MRARETRNQLRCRNSREELIKARRARNASTAYSEKCPAFRVRKWATANCDSLRPGKNQSSIGRSTCDVLAAENLLVEANEIKIIHNPSGPYRQSRPPAEGVWLFIKAENN